MRINAGFRIYFHSGMQNKKLDRVSNAYDTRKKIIHYSLFITLFILTLTNSFN